MRTNDITVPRDFFLFSKLSLICSYLSQGKGSRIYVPSPGLPTWDMKSKQYPLLHGRVGFKKKVRCLNTLHQVSHNWAQSFLQLQLPIQPVKSIFKAPADQYSGDGWRCTSTLPNLHTHPPIPPMQTFIYYLTWELPLKPGGWLYSVESIILLQK